MRLALGPWLAAACVLATAAALPARSQVAAEASWEPLTDDSSRMALFAGLVTPADPQTDAERRSIDLAIPKNFSFPIDARVDRVKNQPREGALFGIDVSHYTRPSLNHHVLRVQDVRFVYVKATQGVRFKDQMFTVFWPALHSMQGQQAVSVGAYHFLEAGVDGTTQAKRFLDYLDLHGGLKAGDMPPCVDLEWDRTPTNPDRWSGVSAADMVRATTDFLAYVQQRSGRRPMIYTARSFLEGRGVKGELLAQLTAYPIWVADYSDSHRLLEDPAVPAGSKPVLWQFASNAHLIEGYEGGLDANIFYGSEADFVREFGLAP